MQSLPAHQIQEITAKEQQDAAFAIRREVFVHEQQCDENSEFDGLDGQATHLLAVDGETPIGTLRIRYLDDGRLAKVERVAVVKPWRSKGVGAELMKHALTIAQQNGCRSAKLHAQVYAEDFYAKCGFVSQGEVFIEEGIDHVAMYCTLAS